MHRSGIATPRAVLRGSAYLRASAWNRVARQTVGGIALRDGLSVESRCATILMRGITLRDDAFVMANGLGMPKHPEAVPKPRTSAPAIYCASRFDTSTITGPPFAFRPKRAVAASALR
jgi:hypothetical protein